MSGKASVQNSAARSRVKLLMLAIGQDEQGVASVGPPSPAAPGRSGRGRRPRASPGGRRGSPARRRAPRSRRGRRRSWPARRACRARTSPSSCLTERHRRHRRQPLVVEAVDRVEADRALLEPAADELLDRALLEDLAVVHDREPVAEGLGLLQVVGRQERSSGPRLRGQDEVPERPPRGRIEAGRRLVEEDQLRVVDERERDRQALALAAGQVLRPASALLAEVEQVDQLVGRPARRVEAPEEVEDLDDRQLRVERRRLERDADPRLERRPDRGPASMPSTRTSPASG